MGELWDFFERHGYSLVFAVVLVEQLGAPVPAVPILVAMGALAKLGHYSLIVALVLAVVASLLADVFWFYLGRTRGERVLKVLCRISLEPDSCVRQTTRVFDRWGFGTLVFAKFLPGLSTVAPPMAGVTGMELWRFVVLDAAGAVIWAGASLLAGLLFRPQAEWLLRSASGLGSGFLVLLLAPLAAYLIWKYRQRQKFIALLRTARIGPDELHIRLSNQDGKVPLIVDLRSLSEVERVGFRLPGALLLRPGELESWRPQLPPGRDLVFYCS